MRVRAHFQIAVGHLAGDRFPEFADGLREGEAFFEERGVGGVVSAYRAKAIVPADIGRPDPTRSAGPAASSRAEVPHLRIAP